MFLDHKGQTSFEFLTIVMILILLAAAVTLFLTSTFDVNYAIYETKTTSLNLIIENQDLVVLNNITSKVDDSNLSLEVVFDKPSGVSCPTIVDYNYSGLELFLKSKTKFNNISISLRCL